MSSRLMAAYRICMPQTDAPTVLLDLPPDYPTFRPQQGRRLAR